MSYKTNLIILSSEDKEISSFINASFFNKISEHKKMDAFNHKNDLIKKIKSLDMYECSYKCNTEKVSRYYDALTRIRQLNTMISNESGLKPRGVLHIV